MLLVCIISVRELCHLTKITSTLVMRICDFNNAAAFVTFAQKVILIKNYLCPDGRNIYRSKAVLMQSTYNCFIISSNL